MDARADRVTLARLLSEIRSLDNADPETRNRLFAAVYDELRELARRIMRDERFSQTSRAAVV
jgi:hypothetical protein